MEHAVCELGPGAQPETVATGEDVVHGGEVGVFGVEERGVVEGVDQGVEIGAGEFEVDEVGEEEEVED